MTPPPPLLGRMPDVDAADAAVGDALTVAQLAPIRWEPTALGGGGGGGLSAITLWSSASMGTEHLLWPLNGGAVIPAPVFPGASSVTLRGVYVAIADGPDHNPSTDLPMEVDVSVTTGAGAESLPTLEWQSESDIPTIRSTGAVNLDASTPIAPGVSLAVQLTPVSLATPDKWYLRLVVCVLEIA